MSKHKVLFEAGPMLDTHKTGVGYYVSHLISSLEQDYGSELELNGYYFNFLNRRSVKTPKYNSVNYKKIWLIPGKILSLCRRLGFQPWLELFVRQDSDIVLFTNYVALPLIKKRKTVLVIYDLSYLDLPEYTQDVNLRYLNRFCSASIAKADVIITISDFTRERINYHFPDLKADIVVTPIPPVSNNLESSALSKRLVDLGIKEKSYILFIGTIEPRKNLVALLKAYDLLIPGIKSKYALVIAGGNGWKNESTLQLITELKARGLNIILTGYISEEEKNAMYVNASCFVMPSHYEGFGMPILEAMQHKIPVAVSDIAVFHEVAGDAAVYFDKDNSQDMADKLSILIDQEDVRESLLIKAEKQLRAYSWRDNAARVYKAII